MKVTVTFDVNLENYDDVCDEYIIEDLFYDLKGKEGITLESYNIKRDMKPSCTEEDIKILAALKKRLSENI